MRKTYIIFALILGVFFAAMLSQNADALLKYGSRGDEVKAVQAKLNELGYDPGGVDGIFGEGTRTAVKNFQADNQLANDGIVGPATLNALGLDSSPPTTDNLDVNLLAKVISAEARGEPYVGQVAVGAVIINRIKHPSFPGTLPGVVYQPGAFTCMTDGQIDQPVEESCYRAAEDAIAGIDPSGGAIYYYNPKTATSDFVFTRPIIKDIGNHRFCE